MSTVRETDAATQAAARSYPSYSEPWWKRVLLTRESSIILLTVVVIGYALVAVPNFDGPLTLKFLLQDIAPLLLIALPMTMIIITGEIDLSVASIVGLSSALLGVVYAAGAPMVVAALVALLAGGLAGALNGYLVAYLGLPSLAVTIGTLALFRGVAVGLLGTTAITDFPDAWRAFGTGTIGGGPVPVVMIPYVLLALVFVLLLHFSVFGRGVYDIGLAKEAAHFTGVAVGRTKFILFVLSGLVSAFAGIYFTMRFGTSRGDNATGMELQVIAAVLLGGVSIFGGRGRLHGVISGVVLIGVISSALRLERVNVNATNVVIGLLLVASVVAPQVAASVRSRLPRIRNRSGSDPGTDAATAPTSEQPTEGSTR